MWGAQPLPLTSSSLLINSETVLAAGGVRPDGAGSRLVMPVLRCSVAGTLTSFPGENGIIPVFSALPTIMLGILLAREPLLVQSLGLLEPPHSQAALDLAPKHHFEKATTMCRVALLGTCSWIVSIATTLESCCGLCFGKEGIQAQKGEAT